MQKHDDAGKTSQSSEAGVSWTRADAAAGNAEAQFCLALCCASAPEPRDYSQAAEWYSKAADQNHPLAQYNLGIMFAKGQGVQRNDGTAVMWIRRAADLGDAGAQFNLGNRYQRASLTGVEMDAVESRIEAYKWFRLAAAQNYRGAMTLCDSATLRMTRDEVTEGNRRADAFALA
jgi:hypothetical protein